MGGVNSVPNQQNILDQIENKDYSVVSINQKPWTTNKISNKVII